MAAEVTLDLEGWYEFKAQHLGPGQQAPVLVEDQVIQWMAELMRLPSQSSGRAGAATHPGTSRRPQARAGRSEHCNQERGCRPRSDPRRARRSGGGRDGWRVSSVWL